MKTLFSVVTLGLLSILERPKLGFLVVSILTSIIGSLVLALILGDASTIITFFFFILASLLCYAFAFLIKNTVSSPNKFAKKYLGEFFRENSTILDYIGFGNQEELDKSRIPLFGGGKTFLLPGTEIVEVDLSPQNDQFKEDRIFVDKIELEIELEATFNIEETYFAQFNKAAGGIKGKTTKENFKAVFLLFSRTAAQILRNEIENSQNTTYDEILKLNKEFIDKLKKKLSHEEDDHDATTNAPQQDPNDDRENKPVLMENLGINITRIELEIRAKDSRVQKANEEILVAKMGAEAAKNKIEESTNIGVGIASAINKISKDGGVTPEQAASIAKIVFGGGKVNFDVIDLNEGSKGKVKPTIPVGGKR